MKTYTADLHIHSRFSRATGARLTVPHIAAWAAIKGIDVVATGDFTHPVWREELRAVLEDTDGSGLFTLKQAFDCVYETGGLPLPRNASPHGPKFILETEISSIYKKNGATRKVHNLVFMPTFESADRLCAKLEQIGNLRSDGRPILGLPSEKLLETVLETDPRGVVIPAHIWTPWFSLFGSKSGFNSIAECFGELSGEIFAMETGLSSDPDMNRLWSELDHITMVSNSDAHSGENLGREATLFFGEMSYDGIFGALRHAAARGAQSPLNRQAIQNGVIPAGESALYAGTLEFFPEEGKYHLDGHRACQTVFHPHETAHLHGICPICGKPVTVGVLSRVTELADRTAPIPSAGTDFSSLIPLPEIIGELLGVGSKSVKVRARYADLLSTFGSEFHILRDVSESDLRQKWDLLGEAVARMRAGHVVRQGGYDGEYGVVRVFSENERAQIGLDARRRPSRGTLLSTSATSTTSPVGCMPQKELAAPALIGKAAANPDDSIVADDKKSTTLSTINTDLSDAFSQNQQKAVTAHGVPVLVTAGPGSGKTRTLIGRIVHLMTERNIPHTDIAAVTFSRRAADELRDRLARCGMSSVPKADTLHALALDAWLGEKPTVLSDESARALFADASGLTGRESRDAFNRLSLCREALLPVPKELIHAYQAYTDKKTACKSADYTDLTEHWAECLKTGTCTPPWREVLIDEIQDLSPLQLRLILRLLPQDGSGFFGIGDPDQAIYGFRGAHPDVTAEIAKVWPSLHIYTLTESYRSGADILSSASMLLGPKSHCGPLQAMRRLDTRLTMFEAPDAAHEAAWIADKCATLIGATSHSLLDAAQERNTASDSASSLDGTCSPSDIAVLVRIKALIRPIADALSRRGIPCAVPEEEVFWSEPRIAALIALAAHHLGRPTDGYAPNIESIGTVSASAFDSPRSLAAALASIPPFDALLTETPSFRSMEKLWHQCGNWADFIDRVTLLQSFEIARDSGEKVRIMTIHASKGLEFRAVFLPALEEGILPFVKQKPKEEKTSTLNAGALCRESVLIKNKSMAENQAEAETADEERRILYVGMTRAAEALYISYTKKRTLFGQTSAPEPSSFLSDIKKLFSHVKMVRHVKTSISQSTLPL